MLKFQTPPPFLALLLWCLLDKLVLSSTRRLLSNKFHPTIPKQKSVWTSDLVHDTICIICADRFASTKYNASDYKAHRSKHLFFPQCHGHLYCDLCIKRIIGDMACKYRRCPNCRRPISPRFRKGHSLNINTEIARYRTSLGIDQVDQPDQDYESGTSTTSTLGPGSWSTDTVQRGYAASTNTRDIQQMDNASNLWVNYVSYIDGLQQRDNSSCKEIKIWQIHNPLRHRLRNRYYQYVHQTSDFPVRKGCVQEFAEYTLLLDWYLLPVGVVGCSLGFTVSLCCCFWNGCSGSFCRDICLCEPPLHPHHESTNWRPAWFFPLPFCIY